jgi:hypothetical protein
MAYVIAASILSIVVSIVYLGYVWISFRQASQNRNAVRPDVNPESSDWESESWFSWKAFISIILSSLFAVGKSALLWNYVPFIAIGSAVAVILAFSIELRKKV